MQEYERENAQLRSFLRQGDAKADKLLHRAERREQELTAQLRDLTEERDRLEVADRFRIFGSTCESVCRGGNSRWLRAVEL